MGVKPGRMSDTRQKSSKFYQTFMKEVIKVFQKTLSESTGGGIPSQLIYEVIITLKLKLDRDTTTREYYKPIYVMNIDTKILKTVLANKIQ